MTEIKIGNLVRWHDSTFLKTVGLVLDHEIRYSRLGEAIDCYKVRWSRHNIEDWFSVEKLRRVINESR